MNGADALVSMLRAYQVNYIFGVPGDTNVPLYAALLSVKGAPRHLMARDERCAGFMADAYARISNKPGVVEVPSGAGAMYALPAIAEAQGSSVPQILITSDTPLAGEGRGVITELDCARLFQPITKASFLVKSAAKIPEVIRRAFRIATSGRPGAVHVAVPEDIQHEKISAESVSLHAESACERYPAYPVRPPAEQIAELHRLLQEARRPLLVVGGGVNRSMAGAALTELAQNRRIPVVTTLTGQNSIPDTHELSIGIVGDNGFHPHANRAMEEADLLIYIGCRNGSVVSIGWTFPPPSKQRVLAQVDIDPTALGNNSDNRLAIVGDARLVLEDLRAQGNGPAASLDPRWLGTLNEWRRQFWEGVSAELKAPDDLGLRPQKVVAAINRRLKGFNLLFADPGTATPYLGRYLRLDDARSRLTIPRAYGGLGYAIPAVVGSWFANPEVRPIGLFGDGSLGMAAGDLETIVRLNVPALLVNFNNSCYGWIKALQRLHGHDHFLSVDFRDQDYSRLAHDFGMKAWHVRTLAELEEALDAAFAHNGPAFIDVVVESIAERYPPVFSWLRRSGTDPMRITGDTSPRAARMESAHE
jgi:acetolactate synthase I/II/III large subunit